MVSSLTLAIMSKQRNYASTLGLDKPPAAAPATPAAETPAPAPASPTPTKP
jgi:hypothetical protein